MNKHGYFIRIAGIVALSVTATFLVIDIEQARAQSAPTSQALTGALIRAGLTATALTAAGLSSGLATGVVNDVDAYMTNNPGVLSAADAAYASVRAEHDRLQRLVQSGVYAEGDLASYATAANSLSAAHAQRQTVLNNIWAAGTADLSETQAEILAKIRANSGWEVPIEFQTIDRTEAQWVALREALANERISAERSESADADAQTLLTQARSVSTVSTALASLSANLASIEATWNGAVTD